MTSESSAAKGSILKGETGLKRSLVIACMAFLNVIDGFDVLAMSFAAPGVSHDFRLDPPSLGLVFSAGFVGMALGAFFLSSLADRYGRRPVLLLCLTLMAIGMAASASCASFLALTSCRVITGLGVGGMLPAVNSVVAEFSTERRRPFAIGVAQTGFPLGGFIGGMVAAQLLVSQRWPSIFLAGAGLSLLGLILVTIGVPETPDWLAQRRASLSLDRLTGFLHFGRGPIPAMPVHRDEIDANAVLRLPRSRRRSLAFLSLCYLLSMAGYYSFVTWLPKLLVQGGAPIGRAAHAIAFVTAGSILGGLGFGVAARAFGLGRLMVACLLVAAATLVAIAYVETSNLLPALGFLFGGAIGSAFVGMFALLANVFPAHVRVGAAGIAVGAGRIGAMTGPLLCGLLLGGTASHAVLYIAMAIMVGAASLGVAGLNGPAINWPGGRADR